jgi:uncharacterized protein (DUF488 family)
VSAKSKVYTIGYSGRTPNELLEIVERLGAQLVDVRYSPASRMPQWSGLRLRQLFGERYTHLRQFGNVNYKNGGPIQLVDYASGKVYLDALDRPAVLMCVCSDPAICHRTTIANLLRADGFEVVEYGDAVPPSDAMSPNLQMELF